MAVYVTQATVVVHRNKENKVEEEYRNYRIVPDGFTMYKIMNIGKGALPKDLSSKYTAKSFAKAAIDGYLAVKGE